MLRLGPIRTGKTETVLADRIAQFTRLVAQANSGRSDSTVHGGDGLLVERLAPEKPPFMDAD